MRISTFYNNKNNLCEKEYSMKDTIIFMVLNVKGFKELRVSKHMLKPSYFDSLVSVL
jgi:hypothetical protein